MLVFPMVLDAESLTVPVSPEWLPTVSVPPPVMAEDRVIVLPEAAPTVRFLPVAESVRMPPVIVPLAVARMYAVAPRVMPENVFVPVLPMTNTPLLGAFAEPVPEMATVRDAYVTAAFSSSDVCAATEIPEVLVAVPKDVAVEHLTVPKFTNVGTFKTPEDTAANVTTPVLDASPKNRFPVPLPTTPELSVRVIPAFALTVNDAFVRVSSAPPKDPDSVALRMLLVDPVRVMREIF